MQLLSNAGFVFEAHPADIDEDAYARDLPPAKVAEYLATAKATHVAWQHPEAVVLGADTVVVAPNGTLLGKPVDSGHARRMLSNLSGSTHAVITGVALKSPGVDRVGHVQTAVRMRALATDEIEAYVAGGQWQGKAGGYGIQDNDPFVTAIEGSVSNVIGLPMEVVSQWLREAVE